MKKILITGKNSFIGTSFENYLLDDYSSYYMISTLDMRNEDWKDYDFSKYDVVFHVAGLAHADIGHVSEETKRLYYKVNTELTLEVAKKAKESNVSSFIFMSSIIVYGECAPVGKKKIISKDTVPDPSNFYGDSKLKADIGLQKLSDNSFKVCIIRPPMIYGKGSRGNYLLLSKLANKLPLFPNINNERSMLYIGNLCKFIKECIDSNYDGIQFPQNDEYVCTSQMVKSIALINHKRVYLTRLLNPFVYFASKIPGKIGGLVNKAFGNLTYEKIYDNNGFITFKESIEETELRN